MSTNPTLNTVKVKIKPQKITKKVSHKLPYDARFGVYVARRHRK